jgi:hypothetical protein
VDFHVTLAFGLQIVGAGFLISWALAFHPQKRLGRFVDFHVTLAFGLQIVGAGFLISWDPGLPATEAKVLGQAPILVVGNVGVRPWTLPT